jgi:hypothetical protein
MAMDLEDALGEISVDEAIKGLKKFIEEHGEK